MSPSSDQAPDLVTSHTAQPLLESLVDRPLILPDQRGTACPSCNYRHRKEFTSGNWATETASAAAFDLAVPDDLFNVHTEVWGVLIQPRAAQAEIIDESEESTKPKRKGQLRIDRVLVPTKKLVGLGWRFGIVGCEIKKSGVKLGRPIAQAMDYNRAVWTLDPQRSRFRVCLDYVFIWPMDDLGNVAGSICAQQRIGSASSTNYSTFKLKSGETSILNVTRHGDIYIGKRPSGAKAGSR